MEDGATKGTRVRPVLHDLHLVPMFNGVPVTLTKKNSNVSGNLTFISTTVPAAYAVDKCDPRTFYETNPIYSYCTTIEIIEMIIFVIGLILNLIVFFNIINLRKLRRKNSCRLFANIQMVHIILLSSNMVSYIIQAENFTQIYINNALMIQLFLSLMLATVDRYVAIKYPYKYERVRSRHVLTVIVCSWIG